MIEAGAEYVAGQPGSRVVDGVEGCAMLIAREVFAAAGLFVEDYFFSFEDLDFCLRARNAGYASCACSTPSPITTAADRSDSARRGGSTSRRATTCCWRSAGRRVSSVPCRARCGSWRSTWRTRCAERRRRERRGGPGPARRRPPSDRSLWLGRAARRRSAARSGAGMSDRTARAAHGEPGAVHLPSLLWTLVRTDLKTRYHKSIGGYLWTLLRPLVMFLVLVFVFSLVFRMDPNYNLNLIVGFFLWDFFAEATRSGMGSLASKSYLLTKARFPAWVLVATSSVNAGVNLLFFGVVVTVYLSLTSALDRVRQHRPVRLLPPALRRASSSASRSPPASSSCASAISINSGS